MKKYIFFLLALIITGGLTYILTPRPYQVHYHANFAVYIDGKKVDFNTDNYMEETSRCNVTNDVKPQDRIHLHDKKGDLVHVHMAASTWGDLFANLHWGLGNKYFADNLWKIYTESGNENVFFYINGTPVDNPSNEIVESTDQLLIWYGTGTETDIAKEANRLVANNAEEYNHKADPASCSTNTYGWMTPIAEPIAEWIGHSSDHK